jgi:hypothetical protein
VKVELNLQGGNQKICSIFGTADRDSLRI